MTPLRHIYFEVEPQSALRSTQTQTWLTKVSEEDAQKLEDSYKEAFDKKGQPIWVRIGNGGKVKTLKSKPNYVRTRRYLLKYLEYKDQLKVIAEEQGFIMPQDAFFMWYFMPMAKSWTKKKKAAMAFKMHKNKKDCDNIGKGVFDALAPRKSNFAAEKTHGIDDRVISSYANAKIYVPDGHIIKPGILIVEYGLQEFIEPYFKDMMAIMEGLKIEKYDG
jgi:Holliday junction resolvase RusA-like endonuclease